ncbi:MAG: DoxX family membrane protein [Candidatus Limnocylindrales bacterium]
MRSPSRVVFTPPWPAGLDRLDQRVTNALAVAAVPSLRIGMGIVFLWFGALKLFPGASPAADLAAQTTEMLSFGVVAPAIAMPLLGAWEVAIGIGLLTGWFLRATLLLLALQMVGAMSPLFLFPAETFDGSPLMPTLEGQYIIKNVVLIAAAMVIGATVRGGRLLARPPAPSRAEDLSEEAA